MTGPTRAPEKGKKMLKGTTILSVSHKGKIVMAGDGQVTLENTVMKHRACKVRKLYNDKVLAGFAGTTADAFTLFELFEKKSVNLFQLISLDIFLWAK